MSTLKAQYCPLCFTRLCYCLCLHGSEASTVFRGFSFLAANMQLRGKKLLRLVLLVSLKLAILKNVLKCCLINKARYRNKRLTTDMADANGLQRTIRPNGFFDIKKMAAHFCSTQCIMDNTGSLTGPFILF